MSAIVIEGSLVHYETVGQGRPVLLLHGWLGSWRYWMSTMQAISNQNRAYALDLWGFGDSDKSKGRYTVSDYVRLVDNFISYMGFDQVALIGHSLGAAVMLEYAIRHPERVDKMMAVSLPMSLAYVNRRLLNFCNNSMITKLIWWRQQTTYQEIRQETEKADKEAITISLQSIAQMNIRGRIQKIGQHNGSTLLAVYGEKDDIIDPGPTRSLNGAWRNVRPMGLAQSKHFPMLDEAVKFHRLVKDFLAVEDNLGALALKKEWRRRTH